MISAAYRNIFNAAAPRLLPRADDLPQRAGVQPPRRRPPRRPRSAERPTVSDVDRRSPDETGRSERDLSGLPAAEGAALGPAAAVTTTVSEAPPETAPPLLDVRGLRTWFRTRSGDVHAVDGVDLTVRRGEVLGLVGESGSGKSVTMLSVLRLVDKPGRIVSGAVTFDGIDVLALPRNAMRSLRGDRISMIFQQPNASLHPCLHGRRADQRGLRDPPQHPPQGRPREGRRDAAHGRHRRRAPARQVLPAPALGRTGAARDDRHGAGRRARAADRRRADDGARRHDPGADPRPHARPPGRARHECRADHPRPRDRRRDGPPRRRDVRRPDRRAGTRRGAVRRPPPSLHPWPARFDPGDRSAPRRAHRHPRSCPDAHRPATRLPLRRALPAADGRVHDGDTGARRTRRRHPRALLPPQRRQRRGCR